MPSSAAALQAAVITRLSTDTALTTALGASRVHDHVPQPPTFPYVVLANVVTRPSDTSAASADDHTLTLHIWSTAEGRLETHTILAAIRAALDDAALTLTDHRLVQLTCLSTESRRDGAKVQGIARFRALTEPL